MKIFKYIIVFSLVLLGYSTVQAKGLPYCSKKVTRGCVKSKRGQVAKTYFAPKSYGSKVAVKSKFKSKSKSKKWTATKPSSKKSKRSVASVGKAKKKKKFSY